MKKRLLFILLSLITVNMVYSEENVTCRVISKTINGIEANGITGTIDGKEYTFLDHCYNDKLLFLYDCDYGPSLGYPSVAGEGIGKLLSKNKCDYGCDKINRRCRTLTEAVNSGNIGIISPDYAEEISNENTLYEYSTAVIRILFTDDFTVLFNKIRLLEFEYLNKDNDTNISFNNWYDDSSSRDGISKSIAELMEIKKKLNLIIAGMKKEEIAKKENELTPLIANFRSIISRIHSYIDAGYERCVKGVNIIPNNNIEAKFLYKKIEILTEVDRIYTEKLRSLQELSRIEM